MFQTIPFLIDYLALKPCSMLHESKLRTTLLVDFQACLCGKINAQGKMYMN